MAKCNQLQTTKMPEPINKPNKHWLFEQTNKWHNAEAEIGKRQ